MKIALCYSGDVRTFPNTIKNHLEAFNVNEGIDIDLFGHIWGELDPYLSSRFKKIINGPNQDRYFWKRAREVGFLPTREHRSFVFFSGQCSGTNALSMFYGIERSINLALDAENDEGCKYDFIFRMRTDLLLDGIKKLDSYDGSKLNAMREEYAFTSALPKSRCSLNDWFAFGNSSVMGKYCRVYSNIKDLVETRPNSPEEMLCTHVEKMGLETCLNDWGLLLCRV